MHDELFHLFSSSTPIKGSEILRTEVFDDASYESIILSYLRANFCKNRGPWTT